MLVITLLPILFHAILIHCFGLIIVYVKTNSTFLHIPYGVDEEKINRLLGVDYTHA